MKKKVVNQSTNHYVSDQAIEVFTCEQYEYSIRLTTSTLEIIPAWDKGLSPVAPNRDLQSNNSKVGVVVYFPCIAQPYLS